MDYTEQMSSQVTIGILVFWCADCGLVITTCLGAGHLCSFYDERGRVEQKRVVMENAQRQVLLFSRFLMFRNW